METQAAERQLVLGGHGNEFGPVEEASFTELVLHERQRHGGAVEFQALDKRNQPRNRSDVVFVPVRKHHAEQPPALSQDGLQRRNPGHVHAGAAGHQETSIPQSTRTHPSGVFHIWQFMPISPNPPRGVIVKKVCR